MMGSTRRLIIVLTAAAMLGSLGAGAAVAQGKGKGHGGGGGSTLTLVLLNSQDGLPHFGQQVTFVVSTSQSQPLVEVDCYQTGVWVYWASAGFYPEYPWPWAQDFTLSSNYWTKDAADCTATLFYWNGRRNITLTTLSFHVEA